MLVLGALIWAVILVVYASFVVAIAVSAWFAGKKGRRRIAIAAWGAVLWLMLAPCLLEILYTPITHSSSLQGVHLFTIEKPRFVDDFGLAALLAYGVTSIVFVAALILGLRPPGSSLGARKRPA